MQAPSPLWVVPRLNGAPSRREAPPVSGDLQPRVRRQFQGTNRPVVVNGRAAYLAAMTDRTPPADSLDQTLADLVEDFDLLGDWEQRIEYVIELGKGLAPLDEADRVEANKVPGCAAQVWLAVHPAEGRLWFDADSDSALSKGNIALLLKLYSGRTPAEILAFDAQAALDRLGLPSALTRQRANGLNSMVGRIREAALATA
jgi:cysteine desulfuration protein SufE